MRQNLIVGLVLGRLAVLKISDWAVKYATFEGNYMFSWAINNNFFLNVVVSALKSCIT